MGGEVMNLHVEGGGLTNRGEAIMEGGGGRGGWTTEETMYYLGLVLAKSINNKYEHLYILKDMILNLKKKEKKI